MIYENNDCRCCVSVFIGSKIAKFSGTSISACIQIIQRRTFFSDDSGRHSAILLVCLIFAVLSYARFTFQIDQTSVLVNKGLFIQKQTILPFERIQTIQENHYFYLRPFKLAEVKLESAASSSGEAEILFPALPLTLIASIEASKRRLRHHNSRMPKQLVEKNQPTITLRFQLRSQPSRR